MTELRFYIPLDTKYDILEMLFPANLLASTEKTKINKNSSGDEIANVNFCTTTTYM